MGIRLHWRGAWCGRQSITKPQPKVSMEKSLAAEVLQAAFRHGYKTLDMTVHPGSFLELFAYTQQPPTIRLDRDGRRYIYVDLPMGTIRFFVDDNAERTG